MKEYRQDLSLFACLRLDLSLAQRGRCFNLDPEGGKKRDSTPSSEKGQKQHTNGATKEKNRAAGLVKNLTRNSIPTPKGKRGGGGSRKTWQVQGGTRPVAKKCSQEGGGSPGGPGVEKTEKIGCGERNGYPKNRLPMDNGGRKVG